MATASSLDGLMRDRAARLAAFLDRRFAMGSALPAGQRRLFESIRYSTLQEGGKRFRPVLAMLTAEALGVDVERVLPFAAAVECVHTYSLIHDDLPAMDDDDVRRGQPTNHKKFDEATAILAGDALLTEAFHLIADGFADDGPAAVALVRELATASGARGMVGGQAIDIAAKKEDISESELLNLHRLKTGALIRVAALGAAIACGADSRRREEITIYAEKLGLAFQVADDILDFDPADPEPGSYPSLLGADRAARFLDELTEQCLASLTGWSSAADPLREIARYNRARRV